MRRRHEKESPSEAPIALAMRQPASWASCAWGMLLPEEESQGKESKESRVVDGTCRGRGRRCTESSCAASFLALALRRNRVLESLARWVARWAVARWSRGEPKRWAHDK